MNKEQKRDCVLGFLNNLEEYEKSSLRFSQSSNSLVIATMKPTSREVDYLVRKVLEFSSQWYSYNTREEEIETRPHARRSALDIWRHCKYYSRDITIFDVMASLYNQRSILCGQFCNQVERRVFRIKELVKGSPELRDVTTQDEFGLVFEQWKEINTEE